MRRIASAAKTACTLPVISEERSDGVIARLTLPNCAVSRLRAKRIRRRRTHSRVRVAQRSRKLGNGARVRECTRHVARGDAEPGLAIAEPGENGLRRRGDPQANGRLRRREAHLDVRVTEGGENQRSASLCAEGLQLVCRHPARNRIRCRKGVLDPLGDIGPHEGLRPGGGEDDRY